MGHYPVFSGWQRHLGDWLQDEDGLLENSFPYSSPTPTPMSFELHVAAQFPGLLRGESPSCQNSSVNLHIVDAEFLPAGDLSGGLQVMLTAHRAAAGVGGLQPCSPPSLLLAVTLCPPYPCTLLFQLGPSRLSYFCPLLSLLSLKNKTKQNKQTNENLVVDGGSLVRTWKSSVSAGPPRDEVTSRLGIPT